MSVNSLILSNITSDSFTTDLLLFSKDVINDSLDLSTIAWLCPYTDVCIFCVKPSSLANFFIAFNLSSSSLISLIKFTFLRLDRSSELSTTNLSISILDACAIEYSFIFSLTISKLFPYLKSSSFKSGTKEINSFITFPLSSSVVLTSSITFTYSWAIIMLAFNSSNDFLSSLVDLAAFFAASSIPVKKSYKGWPNAINNWTPISIPPIPHNDFPNALKDSITPPLVSAKLPNKVTNWPKLFAIAVKP